MNFGVGNAQYQSVACAMMDSTRASQVQVLGSNHRITVASARTPGYAVRLDPERASSGFVRSLVAKGLTAAELRVPGDAGPVGPPSGSLHPPKACCRAARKPAISAHHAFLPTIRQPAVSPARASE